MRISTFPIFLLALCAACGGGKDDDPVDDPDCLAAVDKLEACGLTEDDVIYVCPEKGEATDEEICTYACVDVLSCEGLMSTTFSMCVGDCTVPE